MGAGVLHHVPAYPDKPFDAGPLVTILEQTARKSARGRALTGVCDPSAGPGRQLPSPTSAAAWHRKGDAKRTRWATWEEVVGDGRRYGVQHRHGVELVRSYVIRKSAGREAFLVSSQACSLGDRGRW